MKPITVAVPYLQESFFEKILHFFINSIYVEQILVVSQESIHLKNSKCQVLVSGPLSSSETLIRILADTKTEYILFILEDKPFQLNSNALEKFLKKAESTKAGLIYSDFHDAMKKRKIYHPLNDYQPGSIRDDFDFGPVILFRVSDIQESIKKYGSLLPAKSAGLYDLRLKVSIDHPFLHLQEPLYDVIRSEELPKDEKMFSYLDPRNQTIQKEMEIIFTNYLKKIGAYLPPTQLRGVEPTSEFYPVEASVVVPVKNRKETIAEAIQSALSQRTDFSFNIIVVDNHSTDGTTTILSDLSKQYHQVKHIIPKRKDLGIGGCWNEAIHYSHCGRFCVQLDSDDLYRDPQTLQKIIDMFHQGNYAMVIGSYTLVDSTLKEIAPGLIDHREWTDENGHNNALRVNGLGAPRAFQTKLIRSIGFPNISYGEDYAVALRICREFRIGRIYESLYLCRRWSGNTDVKRSIEERNKNDALKDKIRTEEILARKRMIRCSLTQLH